MSEEQLARLFTPFATAFDGGTGLGMAIVRRIVEDHGGMIDAESKPGEGTVVTILLPRSAEDSAGNSGSGSSSGSGSISTPSKRAAAGVS
jgi:signal transduction histidine kinase